MVMLETLMVRKGGRYVQVGVVKCRRAEELDDDGCERYVVELDDGRLSVVALLGWAPGVVASMSAPVYVRRHKNPGQGGG